MVLFHLGVIKALWSERLLPGVVSGSSAAVMLATHIGAELAPCSSRLRSWWRLGGLGISQSAPLLDKAYSVANQNYSGDVTIVPPTRLSNLLAVFSNPSPERIAASIQTGETIPFAIISPPCRPERIAAFIQTGEQAIWSKLERIHNATRINRAFERGLERLRARFASAAL